MGRKNKNKQSRKRERTAQGDETTVHSKKAVNFSTEDLLSKAEEYVDSFQYELAQKFCDRVLDEEPENLKALELSGILSLEDGLLENAKTIFHKAIELSPENGHGKFMYMGQLHTGLEAVNYFMKGIELMKKHITDAASEAEAIAGAAAQREDTITSQDVSSAYCSVAEIYLTDECFEESAENKCEECLKNAIAECDSNPEPYHLYASFWLSKDDSEKALTEMRKGLALWLPQWQEACEQDQSNDTQSMSLCTLSYPTRINTTKILIELKEYDTANEILELLLDEEDEVVETWYLLGWVNYLQGEDNLTNARFYLGKAQKVAILTQCEDEPLMQHTKDLLEELGGPVEDDDVTDAEDDAEITSDSDNDEDKTCNNQSNGHEKMDQ